jgi:hypothetical protein
VKYPSPLRLSPILGEGMGVREYTTTLRKTQRSAFVILDLMWWGFLGFESVGKPVQTADKHR